MVLCTAAELGHASGRAAPRRDGEWGHPGTPQPGRGQDLTPSCCSPRSCPPPVLHADGSHPAAAGVRGAAHPRADGGTIRHRRRDGAAGAGPDPPHCPCPVLGGPAALPPHPALSSPVHPHTQRPASSHPALCTFAIRSVHPCTSDLHPCNQQFTPLHLQFAPLKPPLCTLAPAVCTLTSSSLHPCTSNLHPHIQLFAPLQSAPCTSNLHSCTSNLHLLTQLFAPALCTLNHTSLHPCTQLPPVLCTLTPGSGGPNTHFVPTDPGIPAGAD